MRNSAYVIRIPEPCHESWDNMKPDNNGRYCHSCEKVVVDFTGKTDLEIHALLRENAGKKTCGHFRTSQLDRPLSISLDGEAIRRSANPRKVFIAALLLVFGSALFSCYDYKNKKVKVDDVNIYGSIRTMGEVSFGPEIDDTTQVVEATKDSIMNDIDLLGQVDPPSIEDSCVASVENDSLWDIENESKDSIMSEKFPWESFATFTGMVAYDDPEEMSADSQDSTSESVDSQRFNNSHNNITVYPNPSTGQFFVKYTVKQPCNVSLELLDLEGKKLMQIVEVKSQHTGEYHIPVDLSSFNPNLYLLRLQLGEKEISSRVVVQR